VTATVVAPTAVLGALGAGESIEERVFSTVRICLDAAGLTRKDVDAVVIAADDIADGRSITTMLHATAAGAYFKDEIRTTNGSLTALGLAATRIAAGVSRAVLVAAWWLPSETDDAIARSSLDVHEGRLLADPARLVPAKTVPACTACVVLPGGEGMRLASWAFGQADYGDWLAGRAEPDRLLGRLGADARRRAGPRPEGVFSRSAVEGPWQAARSNVEARETVAPAWHGLADGLVQLTELAGGLGDGERALAAATTVPAFLQAEAAIVDA
jgi:hypothetical protein